MQKIRDGWWRLLLKDAVTNLYARIDLVRRTDDSLDIQVNVDELAMRVVITFHEGTVSIALKKIVGDFTQEIAREEMEFDGRFTWKEKASSNKG
ncbi:MAG: hypothetical protein ACXABN_19280 [Candidatus Thorarchaeota archaeon]|jgi:hypothetical protein